MSEIRFILDSSLGRLARYLRMLGYDAVYLSDVPPRRVLKETLTTGRFLLTRTRELSRRDDIDVFLVRSDKILEQLSEVNHEFHLQFTVDVMSRCISCNTPLEKVEKSEILESLPPHVAKTQKSFSRCPACRALFWPGTHYARMIDVLTKTLRE
jgi:uncharacterized protein with PIN domain